MTEIERLTAIGTRYLSAAREVILADRSQNGKLYLGIPTTDTIIAIAKVIAMADRQPPETVGQMVFAQPIEKKDFNDHWNNETGLASKIIRPFGDHMDAALVGDRVYLREYVCPEYQKQLTGRVIVGRISHLEYSPIPEPVQHVTFAILRKEGGYD